MVPTWILQGRPEDRWFSSASNLKMSKGTRTLGELRSFSTFQVGHLGKKRLALKKLQQNLLDIFLGLQVRLQNVGVDAV